MRTKSAQKRTHRRAVPSPVASIRAIKPTTRALLCVLAGGRCEFDGCNTYLLEHHVTLTEGVFGEMAHIVAFRPDGPRGRILPRPRPQEINDIRNLMLLCPSCHKLIDDHPQDYTRAALETYKANHEKRIRYVTDLGPDRKTTILILKAPIGGHTVSIPFDHVIEATAPLYPTTREGTTVDLTQISDSGPAFIKAGRDTIEERMRRFFESGGDGHKAQHISVFALAPIPLLVFLGRQLTNKVASDVYQRHRDTENWTWKKRGAPATYAFKLLRRGSKRRVALILSLSGTIPIGALPQEVRTNSTIYVITLRGQTPKPTFLRMRQDLEKFRVAYQDAIGHIVEHHGLLKAVDLFPAVPAPVAVLCGRELLPKVHPGLNVYDYDKATGGFNLALKI